MLLYISIILLVLRQYSKQFTKQSTNQIGRSHSCHFLSVLLCKNNSLFNEHPPVCLLIAGGLSRRYIRAQQPDYRRRTDSQDRAFRNGAERHWKGELVFFFFAFVDENVCASGALRRVTLHDSIVQRSSLEQISV